MHFSHRDGVDGTHGYLIQSQILNTDALFEQILYSQTVAMKVVRS